MLHQLSSSDEVELVAVVCIPDDDGDVVDDVAEYENDKEYAIDCMTYWRKAPNVCEDKQMSTN